MNIESVLTELVEAGMLAKKMDNALHDAGFDGSPYFSIYGNIADAIYKLIGEHTETFDESITAHVLNPITLSTKEAVSILLKAHKWCSCANKQE